MDEVNLLDDHLVDLLLDTAASGVNRVEREGISVRHPSDFILIGTMNPEEGELRPQFLDRFGLCVSVTGEKDVKKRSELVRRRLDFERNPEAFTSRWDGMQDVLRDRIAAARDRLHSIEVPDEVLDAASSLAVKVGAQGHRAEITMVKVAVALAAFQEKSAVTPRDVLEAAVLALPHRLDRFIEHGSAELPKELTEALLEVFGENPFLRDEEEAEVEEEDYGFIDPDDDIFPATSPGACRSSPT